MHAVNITELRNHLPEYLSRVHDGTEISITSHGRVIARIVPPIDIKNHALQQLKKLRKRCKIGNVTARIDENWEVDK